MFQSKLYSGGIVPAFWQQIVCHLADGIILMSIKDDHQIGVVIRTLYRCNDEQYRNRVNFTESRSCRKQSKLSFHAEHDFLIGLPFSQENKNLSVEQAEADLIEEYNDLLICVGVLNKMPSLTICVDVDLRKRKCRRWAERIKRQKAKLEE